MLKIAICDDDKLHRDYTERLAAQAAAEYRPQTDSFDSAEALLRAMSAGDYVPDIAILDIQMGATDGITLAGLLNRRAPLCQIIFLTGFLDFATEVYEAEHIYFILKRDVDARIGAAIRKAVAALSSAKAVVPGITVMASASVSFFPLNEVFLLERCGRKTRVVTSSGEAFTAAAPRELLRDAAGFVRCHQSFWVNLCQVASMKNDAFLLKNQTQAPISRTFRQEARAAFFSWLHGG